MPTLLRRGPFRFYCYAGDKYEPPHVHVENGDKVAKFWLDPIRLQSSAGFSRNDIGKVRRMIDENQAQLLEAWHGYFGQ